MAYDPGQPRPRVQRETPRRVVGGVRPLRIEPDERHWASQRWLRLAEDIPNGEALREGAEYASLGQTRSIEILPGGVDALIQGRRPRAYKVELRLPLIPPSGWDAIIDAIIEDASLAAPLLTGQLPKRIEDVFPTARTTLFPIAVTDLTPTCACADPSPWCKHVVCAMRIAADLLHQSPLAIFRMRGQDAGELLDRLRRRRAAQGSAAGATPAYSARVNLPEDAVPPLEECVENFWEGDMDAIERIDITPRRPEPTHALLRRLGPSAFSDAKFPLVGLLASCYDDISAAMWREAEAGDLNE